MMNWALAKASDSCSSMTTTYGVLSRPSKALTGCARPPPDVIILDLQMPGKSGIEALQEIRAIDTEVAVIMLTGFGSLRTAQKAMRLGANDYIKKPFDTVDMREAVERNIRRTEEAREQACEKDSLAATNAQLQIELEQRESLAALGQASSEFVHDIKGPLTVISGSVDILMHQFRKPERGRASMEHETIESLELIERNTRRCAEMAHCWRDITRQDAASWQAMDVATLVDELADDARALLDRRGGTVEVCRGTASGAIRGDRMQVYRALLNALTNAIDHVPGTGGHIRLAWTVRDREVVITVSDNGPGINEADAEALFEPRVTSRGGAGGMGLGLFITRRIVDAHGGRVGLSNADTGGATARFAFPLAAAPSSIDSTMPEAAAV